MKFKTARSPRFAVRSSAAALLFALICSAEGHANCIACQLPDSSLRLAFLDSSQTPLPAAPPDAQQPSISEIGNVPLLGPAPPAPSQYDTNAPAATLPQTKGSMLLDSCLTVAEMADQDGDFVRNQRILSSSSLCLTKDVFTENGLLWTLQIIRNRASPYSFLWFVPHDDEKVAFNTAAYAVEKYGGTVISIDTGGYRLNRGQDPNRNLDIGTGIKCPLQLAHSPQFTANIMRWRPTGMRMPIIALHSNERGFNGDGQGGRGTISIKFPLAHNRPFPASAPLDTRSPDDTMVFVASRLPREQDPSLSAFVTDLNSNRINVMYETVSPGNNDCSFSNFAALKGIREYANLEVVTDDFEGQRKMVDIVVALLKQRHIEPIAPANQGAERSSPPGAHPVHHGSATIAAVALSRPREAKRPVVGPVRTHPTPTAAAKKPTTPISHAQPMKLPTVVSPAPQEQ